MSPIRLLSAAGAGLFLLLAMSITAAGLWFWIAMFKGGEVFGGLVLAAIDLFLFLIGGVLVGTGLLIMRGAIALLREKRKRQE